MKELVLNTYLNEFTSPERKLIVIGHSKGAVESLLVAMKYNRELKDKVSSWVLIQGAFGGSPLSDYIQKLDHVKQPDNKMPWDERMRFQTSGCFGSILGKQINKGFRSLLTTTTGQILKSYHEMNPIL